MTNEILKDEILKDEQLEKIAGGVRIAFPKNISLRVNANNSAQADGIGDFVPPAKAFDF